MGIVRAINVRRKWGRGADILWVFALMLYILIGASAVPFHGDESTLIMMSRDYHYQFLAGDWAQVFYQEVPANATEQHLRLLNGTLPKYLIGLAWHLGGYTVDDLNDQWLWGADWDWNIRDGHMPSEGLLRAARWPAALLMALSVPVVFALARRWTGWLAAYLASFLFATHPVILIQARRAYMESPLLFFSLLTIWLAVWWAGCLAGEGAPVWRQRGAALALGLSAGLAVASKHSGVMPAAAAYLSLAIIAVRLYRSGGGRLAIALGISAVVAGLVFLALTPAWWGDPLARLAQTIGLRAELLSEQVAAFPDAIYSGLPDRIAGLLRQLSVAPPAYYEVPGWEDYIAGPIEAYRASPWAGIQYGTTALTVVLGGGLFALVLLGGGRLVREFRAGDFAILPIALWVLLTVLFVLVTIPLGWQRYYMPLYPAETLLAGAGGAWIYRAATARASARRVS